MDSVSLTYDQLIALSHLALSANPERVSITNPAGMGTSTVFASFEDVAGELMQHVVDPDGSTANTVRVPA